MTKKSKRDTLILLDMHAILHRGYHALPDFQTSDGQPTGALFGLYTMLLSVISELNPTYIVGCYDLPQPTKRHDIFADYKAGRKEVDPELIAQLQQSRKVLDSFGIPHFEQVGFEADDLLGTIVDQLQLQLHKEKSLRIVIASGDHDTLQLVQGDQVQVYAMRRGIKDTVLYGEEQVIERYGFKPTLLPDYKGLRGDPSDNIPGIPGIGEKTATTLITEFGDLEAILNTAEKHPEKLEAVKIRKGIIKKLQDDALAARFSKELAVIRTDAEIDFNLQNSCWRDNLDKAELLELVQTLQFRSLKNRVIKSLGWESEVEATAQAQVGTLFSTETASKTEEKVDTTITAKEYKKLEEAKLMIWLLNSDQTNPEATEIERVTKTANLEKAWDELYNNIKNNNLTRVFSEIEAPLIPVIDRMNNQGIQLDAKFLKELETNYSERLKSIESQIYKLAGQEFNISSPKQLGEILFGTDENDGLNLPKKGIKKTSSGNFSTAESELMKLQGEHEVVDLILQYRELSKLVNTYISALPKLVSDDGRLRATFVQWGTTTGRMSSRAPNLQNIPIRSELGAPIRQAFIAGKGKKLVAIDYSQIELRIAAWLSGDEALKKVFTSGDDIHASVASDMFEVETDKVTKDMRSAAKTINYGILYGMGANALKGNLNQGEGEEVSKAQALEYLDRYFDAFPQLAEYQEKIKRSVKKLGYTTTYFGRRRYFETIKSKLPYLRAQAERMAINAPIQGTQADIIKLAMVNVSNWLDENNLRDDVQLLLQVHDELVFEISEDKIDELVPKIVTLMQDVIAIAETGGIIMKADAKIGKNWGEMKEFIN